MMYFHPYTGMLISKLDVCAGSKGYFLCAIFVRVGTKVCLHWYKKL